MAQSTITDARQDKAEMIPGLDRKGPGVVWRLRLESIANLTRFLQRSGSKHFFGPGYRIPPPGKYGRVGEAGEQLAAALNFVEDPNSMRNRQGLDDMLAQSRVLDKKHETCCAYRFATLSSN